MAQPTAVWVDLLAAFSPDFTRPAALLFHHLATAWILCPGRHTLTRMLLTLPPPGAHDAFHRFLRAGAWDMEHLWIRLTARLIATFHPTGAVPLDLDDTLFHKSGRKVEGAGTFRDAVRSTVKRVVYARGLNLVVLTLRVRAPWGGEPLGLPVRVRLYRKGGPTHLDLAAQMIAALAAELPGRSFRLCADGAYASLAGRGLLRTAVTSRMRRDAALYEMPTPRRQGQRGRPRKKGKRLPTPEKLARAAKTGWIPAEVDFRGRRERRLLLAREVLWYAVCETQPVLLVVVRDPAGKQRDDFFFTTDLTADPAEVVSQYAGRWSIEDTFRNVKQHLGGEDPQTWKSQGPERAAALSFWLYAAIWEWYLVTYGARVTWAKVPWYPRKRAASFGDALAALRRVLWRERLFAKTPRGSLPKKTVTAFLEVLAYAA